MLRLFSCRRLLMLTLAVMAAFVFAVPSYAQTGALKGKVIDGKGKPVDKAVIVMEYADGINFKVETKSNNKGEYIQIGLRPGNYKVTASLKDLGTQSFNARVRIGDPTEVNFILGSGPAAAGAEEAAKTAELKKAFDDGVTLSKAGSFDEAIAKFNEAIVIVPNCYDCYYNIGYAEMQKKDYDKAEAAFNKAIEVKPTYVEAYNGLATVYNAQRKFDKAAEASQKASDLAAAAGPGATGGGVDAEYNNGVIDWNAGKIAEAQVHFEKVIELKPDHAEAHYQLGMAYLNQGKMPEAAAMFEKYLSLAPTGQFAATATGILKQIKK